MTRPLSKRAMIACVEPIFSVNCPVSQIIRRALKLPPRIKQPQNHHLVFFNDKRNADTTLKAYNAETRADVLSQAAPLGKNVEARQKPKNTVHIAACRRCRSAIHEYQGIDTLEVCLGFLIKANAVCHGLACFLFGSVHEGFQLRRDGF